MQLNVAQETVPASDENRRRVSVEGDPVVYGALDTDGVFVKEGTVKEGKPVVFAHARVLRPTGVSTVLVQDTDDDPDVTAEDADELLADAETRPAPDSLASSSRDENEKVKRTVAGRAGAANKKKD